jgi:ectoine hydroxylase-related dioxygenase (phytanoyl-CoA dioxygenase family)
MDARFACIFSNPLLWKYAADLLECPVDEVIFHFANITRKPAGIGPAINWHRDANNKYIAPADHRIIRLLIPLQNMSETNGGTALLPGSHLDKEITDLAHAVYPWVMAGDVLAIHAEVLHGGSPNRSKEERDVMVLQFGVKASDFAHKANEKLSHCDLKEMMTFCELTSQHIV